MNSVNVKPRRETPVASSGTRPTDPQNVQSLTGGKSSQKEITTTNKTRPPVAYQAPIFTYYAPTDPNWSYSPGF
jgi:hypothetical protein